MRSGPDKFPNSLAPPPWPLIAVLGPTGSGKSDLALRLAAEMGGEIVNCDSVQIYRHFNIGAAKLSAAERRGIPHHLIDIREPDAVFTAGDYSREARAAIDEIRRRGRVAVVAGGTGFYFRTLFEGLFDGPRRDEGLRATLAARQARRPGFLFRLLRRLDPASAARIHPNDTNKLTRAVEVCQLERRPMSELLERNRSPLLGYDIVKIGLRPNRAALYERIDARCERMFAAGLVEETREILAIGYPETCKPFESLGYAQALRVIKGECTVEQALEESQRETRRYAKRQWTWFRADASIDWFDGFGGDLALQDEILKKLSTKTERFFA